MRWHGHRLLLALGVVVPGEVRHIGGLAQRARDELEELIGQEFFERAPFDELNILLTVGTRTCLKPEYQRMRTSDGLRGLPISVDLAMSAVEKATPEELVAIFRQVLVEALIAVAAKYRLPSERLLEARDKQPVAIEDSADGTGADARAAVTDGDADADGGEMLKLYRKSSGQIDYWETWEDDDSIVVHSGIVGDTGETTRLSKNRRSRQRVQAQAEQRRSDGYAEIDEETLATVLLQYRIDGFGTEADLERRHEIEELMNGCLGWTGLGHCDGGDIGSGTMNIVCLVVDADAAIPVIVRELEESGHLEGVTIAVEGEETFDVRWPPDYQGKFSY